MSDALLLELRLFLDGFGDLAACGDVIRLALGLTFDDTDGFEASVSDWKKILGKELK